jgi:hypothetical protein
MLDKTNAISFDRIASRRRMMLGGDFGRISLA